MAKIKTINIKDAVNCIKEQINNGTYDGARIGIIKTDEEMGGQIVMYSNNEVVLFRENDYGTITIEKPMDASWLDYEKRKSSLLTTIGTTVCVPKTYIAAEIDIIDEIKLQISKEKAKF